MEGFKLKNKILFLLLSIVLLTSCTKRDEVAENNSTTVVETDENLIAKDSRIEAIDKERYDSGDSYIEFQELPNTYAETLVANYYLNSVRDTKIKSNRIWANHMHIPEQTPEQEPEYETVYNEYETMYNESKTHYNWIYIERIKELNFEEVKSLKEYDRLFKYWYELVESKLSYDDYVKAVLNSGCKIVMADYEDKYFDYMYKLGPQQLDGKHFVLWLVAEEDGVLKLFENTYFGNDFFISHEKSELPSFVFH